MNPWVIFGAASLAIIISGIYLEKYGEMIAEKFKLSKGFVGLLILAGVTSLPEVATSATASAQGNVDIAIGNVYGSNVFNIVIIVLCDFFSKQGPVLGLISIRTCVSCGFGIVLMLIPMTSMFLMLIQKNSSSSSSFYVPSYENVGLDSVIVLIVYIIAMWMVFKSEDHSHEDPEFSDVSTTKAVSIFLLCSAVVIAAGYYLAVAADEISTMEIGGVALGQSFVGSLLVAAATSLPELVVCLSAVLRGSFEVAVGNIFGSNMFNMLIVFVADVFSRGKPAVSSASPQNLIPGLAATIMSAIVVVAIIKRNIPSDKPPKTYFRIGLESIVLLVVYVFAMYIMFGLRDI